MDVPTDLKAYIDLETALGRVRGNTAIYKKMLGMFAQSAEFDSLNAALAGQDWARVSEVAHGIKGMTGNLGFDKLSEASAQLMQAARGGPASEDVIGAYRDALAKTREYLKIVQAQLENG